MKNRALMIWGGWEAYEPEKVVESLAAGLATYKIKSELSNDLRTLEDTDLLKSYDVIFLCWPMGAMTPRQSRSLQEAVRSGCGLAGINAGLGDAFHGDREFEWMVGGHFVGYPHVGEYEVYKTPVNHPATTGVPPVIKYNSEQYYMLTDPGITVLMETNCEFEGRNVIMPVVWTKTWGRGRVFYSALGKTIQELIDYPDIRSMTVRGLLWAAQSNERGRATTSQKITQRVKVIEAARKRAAD